MIYKILLSSTLLFSLTNCQNQTSVKQEKSTAVENTKVVTTSSTITKDKNPKMSDGMRPDAEAVKIAEQEQANSNKMNVVYLKEGENLFLDEYKMNVTFKGMVEDSRCPKNVDCIWAGNATAEVEFMGLYTRPVLLKISTTNDAKKGHVTKQGFNGYSITLVEVSPETTSDKGFKALKGSYKIALKFEKETNDNSPAEKGGATTK